MNQNESAFKYFVVRKNHFLVVSLAGALIDSTHNEIEQCKTEILAHDEVRAVVLNFAEVSDVGNDIIPLMAQLQQALRSRGVQLRLSALAPGVLDKLTRKGVVRRPELAADIREALLHLSRIAA